MRADLVRRRKHRVLPLCTFLLRTQASRGHGRAARVSGLCQMRRAGPDHGQQQSGGEDDGGRVASASAVVVAPRLAVCSIFCAVPYRIGV